MLPLCLEQAASRAGRVDKTWTEYFSDQMESDNDRRIPTWGLCTQFTNTALLSQSRITTGRFLILIQHSNNWFHGFATTSRIFSAQWFLKVTIVRNFNSISSGVLEPQMAKIAISHWLDWRYCPYNNVPTNVLHCDLLIFFIFMSWYISWPFVALDCIIYICTSYRIIPCHSLIWST